jgi:hypothetical protein
MRRTAKNALPVLIAGARHAISYEILIAGGWRFANLACAKQTISHRKQPVPAHGPKSDCLAKDEAFDCVGVGKCLSDCNGTVRVV